MGDDPRWWSPVTRARGPARIPTTAELLTTALEAAERASVLIHDDRPATLEIETKSTATDNVTNMDLASEALIRSVITSARPDDVIIGEESVDEDEDYASAVVGRADGDGHAVDRDALVTWIIDPIDGTTNYLYDLPGYNISIAAAVDGQVVVGVVADPSHHRIYHATLGGGAFCNRTRLTLTPPTDDTWMNSGGADGQEQHGRGAPTLATALIATGFAYSPATRAGQGVVVSRILPHIRDIRRLGAAALDLCHVAAGRVDGYFEIGLAEWDVAAGALIAREAGAIVTPIEGGPEIPGSVVAAHPAIHPDLQALLSRSGAGTPHV